ncbi:hypothetical protein PGT21_012398 [Puccinia graminis f. sp. tritici]|uniref:Uncharacterized protein n=1 Tax=Puccinia graminis f. sp. tritici TaxID=56615 RepID=A0A5B0NVQ5_PUCGR|nr:hypothetical protein PGT21_012398 [Puccinia graminis f. sp. tritici]KAA1093835.1 hypothetical protein PGTUg99_031532 [Puccinia graminis f. sp. tritici]
MDNNMNMAPVVEIRLAMLMMVSGSDSRHNNHLGFNRLSIINFTSTAMRSRASHQSSSAESAVHCKSSIVLVKAGLS